MTSPHVKSCALPVFLALGILAASADAPAAAQATRGLSFGLLIGGDAQGIGRDRDRHSLPSFGPLSLSSAAIGDRPPPLVDALIRQIDGSDLPLYGAGTRLRTGYYRFGVGLGTDRPAGFAGLSWFSYLGAAVDVVRSGLVATRPMQFSDRAGPTAAAVGGGRSAIMPRLSLYTGLAFRTAPGLAEYVALTANVAGRGAGPGGQGPASLGAMIGLRLRF